MQITIKHNTSRGFAMLDVFLAVIILAITMIALYSFFGGGQADTTQIRRLQANISNIAQSYSGFLNSESIRSIDHDTPQHILYNDRIYVPFLTAVPIPKVDIGTITNSYAYIKSGLFVNGSVTQVGFATLTDKTSGTKFFAAGFKANYSDTIAILQMLSTDFDVYVSSNGDSLGSFINHNSFPAASDDQTYNVYLVTPKIGVSDNNKGDMNNFDGAANFTAP